MNVDVIQNALHYYDINNAKVEHLLGKIYTVVLDNNIDSLNVVPIYNVYDSTQKLLFKTRLEIIGCYYRDTSSWIWGWALPYVPRSMATTIKKVFNYGAELDVDIDNMQNIMLKTELITSR
jgi:hypothetical protein